MAVQTPYQHARSLTATGVPLAGRLQPGEIGVNVADATLFVGDAASNTVKLTALRLFSTVAQYEPGDFVTLAGIIYVCTQQHVPGAWDPANFEPYRMRFLFGYTPGTAAIRNDVAQDGLWLMVANKATTDRAAPQLDGNPIWVTDIAAGAPVNPVDQTPVSASAYITGQRYTFEDALRLQGYRWWAPVVDGSLTYEVWAAINTGEGQGLRQVKTNIIPDNAGWQEIPVSNTLVYPGSVIDLILVTRAVIQPNDQSAVWQVENKNGDPDSEKATFQNNATEIRINSTPKSGDASWLNTVQEGATMYYGGMQWLVTDVDDQGGHVRFTLSPNQGRPSEQESSIRFVWGSSTPLAYVRDDNYWLGETRVQGFEDTTYDSPALNDHAYGLDIVVEQYVASEDWDVMAYSG